MTDRFPKPLSIAGDIRGEAVLQYLIDPRQPKDASELALMMSGVTDADCVSAAVLRATSEEHLEATTGGVTIWPPTRPHVWGTIQALFGPLPNRYSIPDDAPAGRIDRTVFLPTTRLDDMEAAELTSRFMVPSAASAGLSPSEWRYLAATLPALTENALIYSGSPCGAIACGAVDGESGDARLAVVDLGETISGSSDPGATLQACIEQSYARFGGLAQLELRASFADLDASILVRSGTGRSRWTQGHRWRHEAARFVPGFTVSVSIHPRRRRRGPRLGLSVFTPQPSSDGAN